MIKSFPDLLYYPSFSMDICSFSSGSSFIVYFWISYFWIYTSNSVFRTKSSQTFATSLLSIHLIWSLIYFHISEASIIKKMPIITKPMEVFYFPIRGRAETIRLILEYVGVRIKWKEFDLRKFRRRKVFVLILKRSEHWHDNFSFLFCLSLLLLFLFLFL